MCVSEHSEMEEGAVTVRDEQRSGRGCGSCSKGLLPAGTLLGGVRCREVQARPLVSWYNEVRMWLSPGEHGKRQTKRPDCWS